MNAKAPVLVDTSVWIELLRARSHPLLPTLEELVAEDRARLCGLIIAELIQGASSAMDLDAVEKLETSVPLLEEDFGTWRQAGHLGRRLRGRGVAVGLPDCYLASLAIERRCLIFSLDKHFPLIAKHSALELHPALH